MDEFRIPDDRRVRHVHLLAVSIVAMLFGWRWASQATSTDVRDGYWIGVAASALPALAAWWSSLQLRKLRTNGHAAGLEQVFDVLRWVAMALLAFMALFPLL